MKNIKEIIEEYLESNNDYESEKTIKQIVEDWLRNNNYDGLFMHLSNCDYCCCAGLNLMFCGGPSPEECLPGFKVSCKCGENCEFHISPLTEEELDKKNHDRE